MSDKLLKKLTSLPAAIFVFAMIVFIVTVSGANAQLSLDRFVFATEIYAESPRLNQGLFYLPSLFEVLISIITAVIAIGVVFMANKFIFARPRIIETAILGIFSFYLLRPIGSFVDVWWVGPLLTFLIIGATMYVYQRLIVRKS